MTAAAPSNGSSFYFAERYRSLFPSRALFLSAMTSAPDLDISKHVSYVLSLEASTQTSDLLYFTDHKRLSGVYWAVASLALLSNQSTLPQDRIVAYILSCYTPSLPSSPPTTPHAAFAGNTNQDPHLLYTLSGVQLLVLYDSLSLISAPAVGAYVASLQQPSGAFAGDVWGEVDSRFSYCALLTLAILGQMHLVDVRAAADYILSCVNFDGGFGCIPGAESHAGQVFCCVGALRLLGEIGRIDDEALGWWLCERQLECGGFNGRPDKKEDVCYSWWVLASLEMIGKKGWIDGELLEKFIRKCQDEDEGGIADRPGDMPDVFHTFFGLAGLALLGEEKLEAINPVYALPEAVVAKLPPVPGLAKTAAAVAKGAAE